MAFWCSGTISRAVTHDAELIHPFDDSLIKHGAYQLRLGNDYYLTSNDPQSKRTVVDGEQLVVPPGQFALLMTHERVKIPPNVIAFISIRARYKLRGLVNVSGFHVDPGFHGRLKFGVYNAGSSDLVLDQGTPVFAIWFADLDDRSANDKYDGDWQGQDSVTADDVMKLQGRVSSPAQLQTELDQLRETVNRLKRCITWLLSSVVGGVVVALIIEAIIAWWPP